MMLADMGAEVLRIETPLTEAATDTEMTSRRAAFSFVNRNKRSMALNLKHPAGQDILHQIVQNADVLVEGFRSGVMTRLGGDYDTLSKINLRLSYCSLSGFGQDGPIATIRLTIGCTAPWLWENFCKATRREDLKRFTYSATTMYALPITTLCRPDKKRKRFCAKKHVTCAGPVYMVEDMCQDPQVQVRHMVVDIQDPRCGTVRQAGIAIKLSEPPGPPPPAWPVHR
jgi:crotonobetainyl-CoA:carnitine CoA-transferase CaiB-like acyl-CoA transferase